MTRQVDPASVRKLIIISNSDPISALVNLIETFLSRKADWSYAQS